jgi:pyruvate-formate lyase-activating enzyme
VVYVAVSGAPNGFERVFVLSSGWTVQLPALHMLLHVAGLRRESTLLLMDRSNRPALVYADAQGSIFDWSELEMVGSSSGEWHRMEPDEWIPLPPGSELFVLPGRLPVGYDPHKQRFAVLRHDPFDRSKPVQAVAAFMAPAHTQLYTTAYKTLPHGPILPLFAYTALGWHQGEFVVSGVRVDPCERQDLHHFNQKKIAKNARQRMARDRANRLLQHLGRCALSYACPAARNLFMNRWEAPLPTSPVCNSRCLGCISLQEGEAPCATQERIKFVPTPRELADIAVPHLQWAPEAIVSFGQGCEGEPLLQAATLKESIGLMRHATARGTINLNTNGSLPEAVKILRQAGLDSIRVSLNSCRPEYYTSYYRPRGYGLEDLKRSLQVMKTDGGFASINYLVMPGLTDEVAEFTALCAFIRETGLDLIQMRNLNIDPEWYLRTIGYRPAGARLGIRPLMERLRETFPELRFGYFNTSLDPQAV